MRRPHIRCECCRSLHPLTRLPDVGWSYDCDWAGLRAARAPERFEIIYRELTPASKAEREGGAVTAGLRKASRRAEPRHRPTPSQWLDPRA